LRSGASAVRRGGGYVEHLVNPEAVSAQYREPRGATELKSSDNGSGCRQLVLYHSACPWKQPSAVPLRVPNREDQSAVRSKAPPHQRQQHVGIHKSDSTKDRIGATEPPVSRGKEFFSRATREGQPEFQLRELHPRQDDVFDRHIDSVHHSPTTREGRGVGADPTTKLQHPLISERPEDLRCRATSGKLAPLEPARVVESKISANICAGLVNLGTANPRRVITVRVCLLVNRQRGNTWLVSTSRSGRSSLA
jgi:hypothetical protein